jgi:hypothetical protein
MSQAPIMNSLGIDQSLFSKVLSDQGSPFGIKEDTNSSQPTNGIPGLLIRLFRLNKQAQPYHNIRETRGLYSPTQNDNDRMASPIMNDVTKNGESKLFNMLGKKPWVKFREATGSMPSELHISLAYGMRYTKWINKYIPNKIRNNEN